MSRVTLGDVATESKEIYKGDKRNLPIVGLEHLVPGEIVLSNWDENVDNTFTKAFHTGDVLFGRRRAYLKKAAVAPSDGICSGDITVIEAKKNLISPALLPFVIQNDTLFDYAVEKSAGSLSPRVKWEHLKSFEFELPSMEDQKRLAKVLWAINDTIEAYKKLITSTDQLVKSQFIEMFGDPKINPYGFVQTTVGDVCSSVIRGPFGSALKKNIFVEQSKNTYKVYEQKNAIQKSAAIGTYYISEDKFEELRRFECVAGDIIMSCSGTMGELYQLPVGCERGIINQALCKFTLSDKILPVVFLTYMKNTIGNLETRGSGIQNIGAVSYVKAMPINLAPMKLQRQFENFVIQVNNSKLELERALNELTVTYKCILKENLE